SADFCALAGPAASMPAASAAAASFAISRILKSPRRERPARYGRRGGASNRGDTEIAAVVGPQSVRGAAGRQVAFHLGRVLALDGAERGFPGIDAEPVAGAEVAVGEQLDRMHIAPRQHLLPDE